MNKNNIINSDIFFYLSIDVGVKNLACSLFVKAPATQNDISNISLKILK